MSIESPQIAAISAAPSSFIIEAVSSNHTIRD